MDNDGEYFWAIISPSATLTVTYLQSSVATAVANDLKCGGYLAIVRPSTEEPGDSEDSDDEDLAIAHLVQAANNPLPDTYLPIFPCRLGPREPLVPDFEWPFGDCVIDTSNRFLFKPAIIEAAVGSSQRQLSSDVLRLYLTSCQEDEQKRWKTEPARRKARAKAERAAAGCMDDDSRWTSFSPTSTDAAPPSGHLLPPSEISAQIRYDIESAEQISSMDEFLADVRRVKILRARFSRPETERTILWTSTQASSCETASPDDVPPGPLNAVLLEFSVALDRPGSPAVKDPAPDMVPGEDAESDDSDDLWESCRAYNISRVAVPHCPPFEPHSIQVMYFNVFGTLIDHETGIFQALGPLLCRSSFAFERYESLSLYFDAESEMKKRAPQLPYLQILALTYKDMAMRLGLTSTADESSVFASSLFDWPLFDDAVETLRSLHSLVPALVGLVDMDFETCNQLAAYQQLHLYLEGTFAWDGPCTYRPDPDAVYPPLLHHDTLGVPRAHRCIVSNSLVPDLESACWADIPAVWMRCSSTLATNLAITDQNTSFVSMVCTALPKLVSAISDAKVAKSEGVPDVVDVAKLSKLSLVDS